MKSKVIIEKFEHLKDYKQRQLHEKLGAFSDWMSRAKDADEIRKDKRQSVPVDVLPMVF